MDLLRRKKSMLGGGTKSTMEICCFPYVVVVGILFYLGSSQSSSDLFYPGHQRRCDGPSESLGVPRLHFQRNDRKTEDTVRESLLLSGG